MAKQSSVNLDITNNPDGFDISGGTTLRKLSVTGGNVTIAGSGSATVTFPTTSTTIAGLAIAQTFSALQTFSVGISASGATFSGNISAPNIVNSLNGFTGAVQVTGSGAILQTVSGTTTTFGARLATTSLTGVASFNSQHFAVSVGAVSLASDAITIRGSDDSSDDLRLGGILSLTASPSSAIRTRVTGLGGGNANAEVIFDARIASATLTGVASFDPRHFAIGLSGHVSLTGSYQVTGHTVVSGGASQLVTVSGNIATIDNRIATASVTGVASFGNEFRVTSGAVGLTSNYVKSINGATGAVTDVAKTNVDNNFSSAQTIDGAGAYLEIVGSAGDAFTLTPGVGIVVSDAFNFPQTLQFNQTGTTTTVTLPNYTTTLAGLSGNQTFTALKSFNAGISASTITTDYLVVAAGSTFGAAVNHTFGLSNRGLLINAGKGNSEILTYGNDDLSVSAMGGNGNLNLFGGNVIVGDDGNNDGTQITVADTVGQIITYTAANGHVFNGVGSFSGLLTASTGLSASGATFSGNISVGGNSTLGNAASNTTTIYGAKIVNESIYSNGTLRNVGINFANGQVQTLTGIGTGATGTTAIYFMGAPATGAGNVTLLVTNGGSMTGNTTTWEGRIKWPGGVKPTLSTTGIDVISFITPDAGTTIYGFVGGLNFL